MSYLVFDKETTTKMSFKRKANPFDPDNWVVALGYKHHGEPYKYKYWDKRNDQAVKLPIKKDTIMIVGHNIKFDLSWVWRNKEVVEYFKRGGRIWCTQYAEYLLNGHIPSVQMCSMDDIAEKYGGELKVDEVKKLWEAGVDTPDIDEDLLIRYLEGDITNTEKIFLGQIALAKKYGMLEIMQLRMDGLAATIEMEYNGLFIDMKQAEQDRDMLVGELNELKKVLDDAMPKEMPTELVFNWGSHVHKSALVFGGTVKYSKWVQHTDNEGKLLYANKTEKRLIIEATGEPSKMSLDTYEKLPEEKKAQVRELCVTYKSGKNAGNLKTKNVTVDDLTKPKGAQKDHYFTFPGYTQPDDDWLGKLTDGVGGPVWSTSGEVIDALGNRDIKFLKALSANAAIQKDLSTYYYVEETKGKGEDARVERKGMLTCVMDDGFIHHKLNACITVTSRLSSSDP